MPGIAFVRDPQARVDLFQDWVDLTCSRDIHQFKRLKLDGDIALSIMRACATLPEPSQASLAHALRVDGRRVASHIKALCELFALIKLDPHPSGGGKSLFFPLDAGVAHYLGADLARRLHILLINERMVHNSVNGKKRARYFYNRSTGKRWIHLIEDEPGEKLSAFQLLDTERVKIPDFELLKAFARKNPKSKCSLLAPVSSGWKEGAIRVEPWEALVL